MYIFIVLHLIYILFVSFIQIIFKKWILLSPVRVDKTQVAGKVRSIQEARGQLAWLLDFQRRDGDALMQGTAYPSRLVSRFDP